MQRKIFYILLSVLALTATLTITSCKDDDPVVTEENLNKLAAHRWSLTRATVNGVDKTALYSNLILQWNNNKTFSSTNGGVIWPSTGSFSFTDDAEKILLLSLNINGDTEVSIQTLTDTQLVISFHWNQTTTSNGRSKSIEGDHIFEFSAVN